jgi:hypothetical protein
MLYRRFLTFVHSNLFSNVITIIALVLLGRLNCIGQVETILIINGDTISLLNLDTLKQYSTIGNFKGYAIDTGDSTISFYYGENKKNRTKKLTKKEYYNFNLGRQNLSNCRPCWLKTFDIFTGELIYEGPQYTDARIGEFLVYYDNGKLKAKGRYSLDNSNKKVGVWKYFKKNGKIKEEKNHDLQQ